MIFVTVGAQMPFDRLIITIDNWAGENKVSGVFAQIGKTKYKPKNIKWVDHLDPQQFRRNVKNASVIISHAGMGTILTAMEYGKPILVMPRRADLAETRSDHQIDTAKKLVELKIVNAAFSRKELTVQCMRLDDLIPVKKRDTNSTVQLIDAIKKFINSD